MKKRLSTPTQRTHVDLNPLPLATTFREAGIKIRRAESEEPTITLPTAKLPRSFPRFGGKFGKIWDSNLADLRKFKKGKKKRSLAANLFLVNFTWKRSLDQKSRLRCLRMVYVRIRIIIEERKKNLMYKANNKLRRINSHLPDSFVVAGSKIDSIFFRK